MALEDQKFGLESYFPYIRHKERSPIVISWNNIKEEGYRIFIIDSIGYSVHDFRVLKKDEMEKEVKRLTGILEDRGYVIKRTIG